MKKHKPLSEQVIVITGASSGIGLATSRLAVERGARVVLSSFDPKQLREAEERLQSAGGEVLAVEADVAEPGALERVAARAVERFGRIDTWVNNAGVHMFGRLDEVALDDARRVFEVNYWGVVHGCRAAVPRLAASGGGTLINVESVLSSRSIPLQGIYTASKHAIAAYTKTLRTELQDAGVPVTVTAIKPAAMHTPIAHHSKSLLKTRAQLPPPIAHPEVTARVILHCAVHPRRSMVAGGAGLLAEFGEKFAPKAADLAMRMLFFRMQHKKTLPPYGEDALHASLGDPAREVGEEHRHLLRHSALNAASRHPWLTVGLLAGAGLAAKGMSR